MRYDSVLFWVRNVLSCSDCVRNGLSQPMLEMLQCVAVCYSVLQCVAVCCSVLQCVAAVWLIITQSEQDTVITHS